MAAWNNLGRSAEAEQAMGVAIAVADRTTRPIAKPSS